MYNLAELYRRQSMYAEAEPLYVKVLDIRRRVLGPQHPDTIDVITSLGALRLHERRYDEAEPLLGETLKTLEQISPDNWKRYYLQTLLGAVFVDQKRYTEAEPLLLSGYAGLMQRKATIPAPSKSDLADAGDWIVELYREWGQPDKAREWQARLESEKAVTTTP